MVEFLGWCGLFDSVQHIETASILEVNMLEIDQVYQGDCLEVL